MNHRKTRSVFPRVAIVHDAVLYAGGAEQVLIALLQLFPTADMYTAFFTPQLCNWINKFFTGTIYVSPFDRIPYIRRFADWFKLPLFYYWKGLNLSRYDIVISSSHSFSSKAVVVAPGALHISYVHTPPRYLYTEYNETRLIKIPLIQFFLAPFLSWARALDYQAAQRPHVLVANSKTVRERVRAYYQRESVVIYPPVKIPKRIGQIQKKEYFLCVSRLVKQKGTALAIGACNALRLPLVVVGTGKEERFLRAIAGSTIIFLGFVPDDQIDQIYRHARGLIFCSHDEDFGMVPVEAMAHGVPVIAYNSGGVQETVVDGKTGVTFADYGVGSLIRAIQRFENLNFSQKVLRTHAKHFSEERFDHEFKSLIDTFFQNRQKQ